MLFCCLFASQTGLLVLTPTLAAVARDLDVSVAAAGQLRTVSGLVAGGCALAMGRVAGRVGLRDLLLTGAALLAFGSLVSAVAPGFALLALAQVVVGVALALLVSGAVAAAAEWAPPGGRSRLLSRAFLGQPAAWVVGMPLIGLLAEAGWRYAWLAVPFVASIVAAGAAASRPRETPRDAADGMGPMLRDPSITTWAAGELLAYAAWAGTLVYAGALFIQSYGLSPAVVGVLLAASAIAYVPGNVLMRRWVGSRPRLLLVTLALAMAGAVALFAGVRPDPWTSAALLGMLSFLAGGRTLAGGAFGLAAAPQHRVAVMGVRAAAQQFGYFLGAVIGGLTLSVGGYTGMAAAFATLLTLAAAATSRTRRPRRSF